MSGLSIGVQIKSQNPAFTLLLYAAPECGLRVVPQLISRFVRTASLNDADLVVVLLRKLHC